MVNCRATHTGWNNSIDVTHWYALGADQVHWKVACTSLTKGDQWPDQRLSPQEKCCVLLLFGSLTCTVGRWLTMSWSCGFYCKHRRISFTIMLSSMVHRCHSSDAVFFHECLHDGARGFDGCQFGRTACRCLVSPCPLVERCSGKVEMRRRIRLAELRCWCTTQWRGQSSVARSSAMRGCLRTAELSARRLKILLRTCSRRRHRACTADRSFSRPLTSDFWMRRVSMTCRHPGEDSSRWINIYMRFWCHLFSQRIWFRSRTARPRRSDVMEDETFSKSHTSMD